MLNRSSRYRRHVENAFNWIFSRLNHGKLRSGYFVAGFENNVVSSSDSSLYGSDTSRLRREIRPRRAGSRWSLIFLSNGIPPSLHLLSLLLPFPFPRTRNWVGPPLSPRVLQDFPVVVHHMRVYNTYHAWLTHRTVVVWRPWRVSSENDAR